MKFNKACVMFWRVWTKNTKCWEILRKFSKILIRHLWKCFILAYFSKDLTNPCVHFSPFGQKTQIVGKFWENFENFWWKFNWKLTFIRIFGKFVTKKEPSEITPFFYNNFFGFGGGGISHPSLPNPPMANYKMKNWLIKVCLSKLLILRSDFQVF